MAIDLGRWFRDRKRQVEGVAAQVNPFDNGKTYSSVVQNTPVQTSTQVNQRSAQPPSNRTSNLINPQKPTWLDNQAFTVSSRPIAQPNFQAPKPNGSLQQEIDKSYGRGLSSLKNRLRDVVDSNTQADRIRRVAQTGLDESYQDQQARLTRDAMSRKDGDNIGAQTSGAFFKEGASFVGKSPSSIAQIQARVASSNNPLVRYGVGAVVPGAQYGLLPGGNKRGEQILRASQGINTTIDNKLQQSGLGDRADHNKWARGAGSVGFQLPALLATGPFGLAAMGSQTAADEANKAEMAGRTNEQALGIGLLQGGASMVSEKFGLDRFLPGNGTAATSIKPFLGNMAKRIGTEGAQEAQQQFTQNLISNKTYNPNQGLKEGVFESAVLGGLSGGAMSGAKDLPNVTRNTNIKLSPLDESGFIDVPKQDLIIKNGEGKAMSVEKDPLEALKAKSTNEQTDPVLKALTDHTGKTYTESQVPVSKLVRRAEFQPRTTKSGIGTENSVFEKGYQEGLVDQPLLVRKNGDSYEVLGGHSRTSGMERRAEAGLPNPESVKARVYENITDAEARAISRSANQGGQYESTLDMAKSISDSLKEGAEPSVQKQNMLKGYTTEDYSMLWDVVGNDTTLKDKVFHGAISQEDMLAISRQARLKNLDADTARAIVSNMDKNGTLTKTVAKNVISMIASKRLKTQMSDAQSGMFDLEVLTTPDATKLASDRAIVEADLKSRINALNKVKKEGISKEAAASLEEVNKSLAQKMHDIEKEVIAKYNADIEAKNAAQASLSIDTKSTADKPSETATPKSTAKLVQSTPIKVQGSTSQKNIPARKLERSGDVVTATNVNPNIKATEKRFSIDDDGNLIEDRKGAYRIFNDGEGKITGVRIGEEYHSAKELGDLSDVNDYGSSLATMRRNIERSFGKETGDKLSKFVVDHQQKQATKLIRRQLELKQGTDALAKELGISFGIGRRRAKKVSASIQDYGEGNITRQDLVSQYGENMANKIIKADKWFKNQYNQLLDEMNKVLTTYGYDPVQKRKNYYTHFQDQGLWSKVGLKMQEIRSLTSPTTQDSMPAPIRGSIDNRLAGQSEFMTPNKRFNPFALQRKGDAHTSDAFQSFERYLTPTLNNIYMTPSITRARVVSQAIAEQANLAGKDANGVIRQTREWANRLAGKTSRIDRPLVDSKWGNQALRVSQWAQRKAGANTIVGNLSTAVMQPVVLTQTIGKFGLKNTLLATVQEMSTAHSKFAPIRKSEFMTRRYADLAPTTSGKIDRAADIANTPLKVVEETATRITWNAAHNDALSKGMKGDAAIRYADIQTDKTVSGRSIGERPELFDAKAPGLISMYQLEVNNYWQQVGKEMTKAQAARTMAAGYAFNLLLGAINGRSVGFNPIDAILDSIGMLDDEEEPADKAKRIAQRLSGELIDSLPFTGAVGSTLMGDQRWKDTLGKDSTSGRFGFNNAPRTLIENPGMLVTPFGYNQARKTIQGIDTWRKGQLESKSGKKLIDIDQSGTNLAKVLAFGKSAIPEVNQYYDSIGKKKTIKSNTGVEGIIAEKARLNEELRNTLSDDDYTIYKMSKADREKVVKAGIKSQSDIDGLDNYVNQQKKRLGIKTEDKTDYYKSNDAEYNSFKKEYDDKIKNNEYTKAGKIKAENKLRKLEVGKPYSKDARDLYDINKSQLAKWLSTDEKGVDKQKLHDELIAYDQALYDAGLIKYKKFKGGVATGRNGKGGSRKGGGKSKIDIAQILSKSNLQVQHSQNLSKLLAGTTFKGTKTKPSTSKNKSKVAQKTIKVDMRA